MASKFSKLTVKDVMSTEVKTARRNDSLAVPDQIMASSRMRHVLVLDDDGELCGVVSGRDLFRGALLRSLGFGARAEQTLLETMLVKEVMSENLVTTTKETSLGTAATTMIERNIGCLPVLEKDALVGIITEGDVVRLVARGDS